MEIVDWEIIMSRLIEFIPFQFGAINGRRECYVKAIKKAAIFFIPFILAIYPLLWAHGKIYDVEMWMLTQADKQAQYQVIVRDLDIKIKLLEDQMAKKRADTFFIIRYLKDMVGMPIDYELATKITLQKYARDEAVKATKSADIPSYIKTLKRLLEFLSTITLLYILFISVRFYLYLLFRLAPSSGIPVVYAFPHSDREAK